MLEFGSTVLWVAIVSCCLVAPLFRPALSLSLKHSVTHVHADLFPPPSWKCLHSRGLSTPRESTIRGRLFQGYAEILCGIFLSPTEFFPNKDTIAALTLFPFPVISKDRVSAPNMFRLLISLNLIKVSVFIIQLLRLNLFHLFPFVSGKMNE